MSDHDTFLREMTKSARDAEARIRRAARRGTGCHLSAEMVRALKMGVIGEDPCVSGPTPRIVGVGDD